jgi:hypothetical protein
MAEIGPDFQQAAFFCLAAQPGSRRRLALAYVVEPPQFPLAGFQPHLQLLLTIWGNIFLTPLRLLLF